MSMIRIMVAKAIVAIAGPRWSTITNSIGCWVPLAVATNGNTATTNMKDRNRSLMIRTTSLLELNSCCCCIWKGASSFERVRMGSDMSAVYCDTHEDGRFCRFVERVVSCNVRRREGRSASSSNVLRTWSGLDGSSHKWCRSSFGFPAALSVSAFNWRL